MKKELSRKTDHLLRYALKRAGREKKALSWEAKKADTHHNRSNNHNQSTCTHQYTRPSHCKGSRAYSLEDMAMTRSKMVRQLCVLCCVVAFCALLVLAGLAPGFEFKSV